MEELPAELLDEVMKLSRNPDLPMVYRRFRDHADDTEYMKRLVTATFWRNSKIESLTWGQYYRFLERRRQRATFRHASFGRIEDIVLPVGIEMGSKFRLSDGDCPELAGVEGKCREGDVVEVNFSTRVWMQLVRLEGGWAGSVSTYLEIPAELAFRYPLGYWAAPFGFRSLRFFDLSPLLGEMSRNVSVVCKNSIHHIYNAKLFRNKIGYNVRIVGRSDLFADRKIEEMMVDPEASSVTFTFLEDRFFKPTGTITQDRIDPYEEEITIRSFVYRK